jgi:NADH-quinone oxidoreductase subunit K
MTPEHYIVLAIILFSIGLVGTISRRNLFVVYMSIEMMLNSINLVLAAFSRTNGSEDGGIMAIFMIAVIAAEAVVFLAMIISLYKMNRSVDSDEYSLLKQRGA